MCIGVFKRVGELGLYRLFIAIFYIRDNRFVVLVEVEGGFLFVTLNGLFPVAANRYAIPSLYILKMRLKCSRKLNVISL